MEQALLKQTRSKIADRVGLLVREQDDALLGKVVADRVRALNLSGVEQYCQFLDTDEHLRHEREVLAIHFTMGETYFFRDSGQYALLKDCILPELLECRKTEQELRIWCAACSSGEEAYSLAILLDELMDDQSQWFIFILGTDINHSAIEKARQGIYTEWSFRGISNERRERYFHRHKNMWVLDDGILNRVTFRTGDLIADEFPDYASGPSRMDLILCRNTFIYMDAHVVSRIADKFAETLAEGGILMTGHGELQAHHLGKLRARVFPESVVYQKVTSPALLQPPFTPAPVFMPVGGQLAETHHPDKEKPAAEFPAMRKANDRETPLPQRTAAQAGTGSVTPDQEMQQAWQCANTGQREMAAKLCAGMVEKNPLVAEPHYLLALLAQERGDFAEARQLLKKVLYLDHSFIAAYLDLGDLYARNGDGVLAGKMRATARDLLKALPGDESVKLYGNSSANAILQYVEHLLSNGN